MNFLYRIVALCMLLVSTTASAADAKNEFASVAESFENAARKEQVVGGSIAIIKDGAILGERHFGMADEKADQAVDASTIYHWASITKTFTAIALMQQVQRGKIGLDDPVVKYIPEFRAVHNPFGTSSDVTVRHLLTHTSGLREGTWPWNADGAGKTPEWQSATPPQWDQIYSMFPYTGLSFKPGSAYAYSNPGSSLMGRIVEIVSGDDIEVYIDKNILKPLGMYRTYFDVTPWHLARYRSASYLWRDGKRTDFNREFDTGATNGNGGLNAPVGDMILYLNFLLGLGNAEVNEAILPRKTLEEMWQPIFAADYDPTVKEQMGQSFFVIDAAGRDGKLRRYVGHTGSQEGYRSFIYLLPNSGTAAIMAVNTTVSPGPRPLVFETRRALFERVFPLLERKKR